MINCPWYIRWYHKRLRDIDRNTLFIELSRQSCDPRGIIQIIEYAKFQPGMEHWHCSCSPTPKKGGDHDE